MPGTTTNIRDADGGGGIRSRTGRWLVVGLTQKGSTTRPIKCRSLSEVVRKTGARVTYGLIYDVAEAFFRLGGSEFIIGRAVGASAVQASVTLVDGSSNPALTVKANSPGDWANGSTGGLKVQVVAGVTGGTFILKITLNGVLVEQTPELADAAAAIAWATANSQYVVIVDPGAVGDPAVVSATNLAGGTDNRGSLNTASWQAALDVLAMEPGCGTVSAPGVTSTAVQQALIDHADAHNRTPIVDLVDSSNASTVAAQIAALTGIGLRRGAAFDEWAVIPGVTRDTTRTIPWSAVQAAMIARNDGAGAAPNVGIPVAADNGIPGDFVLGLSQDRTPADWAILEAARVNTVRIIDGVIQTYGNQTLIDPDTEPAWQELSAARLYMYVADAGDQVSKRFVFKLLDHGRKTIGRYGLELQALLVGLGDQLYNDPATAVDVGSQVNTDETIAARELHADLTVQPANSAWDVVLNVGAKAV